MNIVLVHGMGGTSSTWESVAPELRRRGHAVQAIENPLTSLTEDVANTVRAIESIGGPVLLVGHSYGGAVITNAGAHPDVAGLVYVAAFAPDEGEAVQDIVNRHPPAQGNAYMKRGPDGEWITDFEGRPDYWEEIASDLTPKQRESVAGETRWTGAQVFTEPSRHAAWRHLPSWYLLAEDDRTLRPDTQAWMAERIGAEVTRIPGSHFTTRVHATSVADLIDRASTAAAAAGAT